MPDPDETLLLKPAVSECNGVQVPPGRMLPGEPEVEGSFGEFASRNQCLYLINQLLI